MPSSNQNGNMDSWKHAFKEQVIWFVFAILLAVGGSYATINMTVASLDTQVENVEEDIDKLEKRTEDINDISYKLNRIRGKIDVIIQSLNLGKETELRKIRRSDSLKVKIDNGQH